jgi:hypothetical protein
LLRLRIGFAKNTAADFSGINALNASLLDL